MNDTSAVTEKPKSGRMARLAVRIAFYGALIVIIAYGQPVVRCFYNPLQEKSLGLACFAASNLEILPASQRASALFIIAQDRSRAGDFEAAIGAGEKALTLDESQSTKDKLASVLNSVGDTLMAQKLFVTAVPIFSRTLQISPTNRQALNQRGYAYQNMKQFEEAAADYSAMIERDASDKAGYGNRAQAYIALGKHRDAIADLTDFIKLDGKDAWSWSARAEARRQLDDNSGAIEDADASLVLNPKNKWTYETKVRALSGLGRYDDAVEVVDLWEQSVGGASALTENLRAAALQKAGRIRLALGALDRAIKLDPMDAWAFRMRGFINWQNYGNTTDALRDFDKAIEFGDTEAAMYKQKILGSRTK